VVETGRLPAEGVQRMFDRIAPVYDAMNRGDDRRSRPAVAAHHRRAGGAPGRPGARRLLRHGRPRPRGALPRRGRGGRARLLGEDARARANEGAGHRMGAGRPARASVRGRVVRLCNCRLRHPQRRRSRGWPSRAAARPAPRREARDPGDHDAARRARALLPGVFDRVVPLLGRVLPGRRRIHVPAGERAPLPGARGARAAARGETASATCGSACLQGVSWPFTWGETR